MKTDVEDKADDVVWTHHAPQLFLGVLRGYAWLILLVLVAALAIASVYLRTATYRYSAELKVTAAQQQRELTSGLGGLASLAGVNLPGAGQASPVALYLETMRSRDVADALAKDQPLMRHIFADQWDPAQRMWREPRGALSGLAGPAKAVLGVPSLPWQPPGGGALRRYLDKALIFYENTKTGITTLIISDPDPKFAVYLLESLDAAADRQMRQRASARATAYITYLRDRLPTVTIAEQRLALLQSLSDQEKQQMMASARSSYAVDPIGRVSVDNKPTSPKPVVVLAVASLVGLALGVLAAMSHHYLRRPTTD